MRNKQFKYSGGRESYEKTANRFNQKEMSYILEEAGSSRIIDLNGRRFKFNLADKSDGRVGACCRAVLRDVIAFEAENEKIITTAKPSTAIINERVFVDLIMSGIRTFSAIDAKFCYWAIVYKAGIITKKTFDKYRDQKELRLVAIGNLNKNVRKTKVIRGQKDLNGSEVVENSHAWVWNYVLSEAYDIYEKVHAATNGSVFKFKTDCVFVEEKYTSISQQIISDMGYESTIKTYQIAGMENFITISYNIKNGDEYKSNFGGYRKIRGILPKIKSK